MGAKRGGEGGGKREKGENERELTLSPQSLSLFPFLPIPYPFRRLATIFSKGKTRAEKKVSAPRRGRLLDGEYRKRFAAIGKMLSKECLARN